MAARIMKTERFNRPSEAKSPTRPEDDRRTWLPSSLGLCSLVTYGAMAFVSVSLCSICAATRLAGSGFLHYSGSLLPKPVRQTIEVSANIQRVLLLRKRLRNSLMRPPETDTGKTEERDARNWDAIEVKDT